MSGPTAGVNLSFLAPTDQQKYETLFSQAAPNEKYMTASTAKEVLSRSGLDGDTLAKIWDLSNVTQEARLSFPEFAVAMYLTSMRMTGRDIPPALPDTVRTEIQAAVAKLQASESGFLQAQPTGLGAHMTGMGPTPQRSLSTSALGGLSTQQLQAQMTGYPSISQQPTGITQQPTGLHSQPTGPAHTPPLSQQPTGMTSSLSYQPTGIAQQPTGMQIPMMTGVTPIMGPQVAMPTGMGNNNLSFANSMMPGSADHQPYQAITNTKVKIPWAVTTEEKKRYSKIFKAWDTERKGILSGDKARHILEQSGLPHNVLMQIWALADPNNQGKLNIDEFAVAMHLIYRKLNGHDVPTHLPPELIPPSTRELRETVSDLKNSILKDIATKRGLSNFSSSPSLTPPSSSSASRSTPRARSVSPNPSTRRAKDRYKDEDNDDGGYVSSARRMGPDRSRTQSPASSKSSSYGYRGKTTRISELRKQIAEHKDKVKRLEEEAVSRIATPYDELSFTDRKDIDDLKDKIRELQTEIAKSQSDGDDGWATYAKRTTEMADLTDQTRSLESEIQFLIDETGRALVRQLRETEQDLADKKAALAKAKQQKNTGSPELEIVGTGPGGAVTEQDRIKAKAKAMVAARLGKVKQPTATTTSGPSLDEELKAIEQEKQDFMAHAESMAASLQTLEDSVNAIHMEMSMIGMDIRKHEQDQKKLEERRRFEAGERVAADLKVFVQQLAFETATARAPDVDPGFESRFPAFE
ncbi:hypothetical protein BCR43DRAFT_459661 [Syncephalastrum racemosum]|uniref:Actin cytoskeleton-regulatory complex protein pan1 n=1 Tax=Syncephalastrum racemosum TaxID=13706 RepID=A0A1X2HAU9_SYNRA|nr:hypothetical protein BCR43DRAFT_459661 [Syncephalastrum racemosum]